MNQNFKEALSARVPSGPLALKPEDVAELYDALVLCKRQLQSLNLPRGTQNEALQAATAILLKIESRAAASEL